MKVKDFAKLYFALLLLAAVLIYRPHSEALQYISKPIMMFSLLAFFLHRSTYQELKGNALISLGLFFMLVAAVIRVIPVSWQFPGGFAMLGLAHIMFALFQFGRLRRPINLLYLLAAVLVPLAGWAYLQLYYTGGNASYKSVFVLVAGIHVVMAVINALTARTKLLWMLPAVILWYLTDSWELLHPEFFEQKTTGIIMVMARYSSVFALSVLILEYDHKKIQ